MCLSTLYRVNDNNERVKLGEYISNVECHDGEYVFTDVMGDEFSVRGCIRSMDFVRNEITIKVDQQDES